MIIIKLKEKGAKYRARKREKDRKRVYPHSNGMIIVLKMFTISGIITAFIVI